MKMGQKNKKNHKTGGGNVSRLPKVSCACPTIPSRLRFIRQTMHLYMMQDYAGESELVIFEDGGNSMEAQVEGWASKLDLPPNKAIVYKTTSEKLALGKKRQELATLHCSGELIVFWDDDDYYYPTRVSYTVRKLLSNPNARGGGCSEQEMFFATLGRIYFIDKNPSPFHATAGTMGLWKKYFFPGNGEDPPLCFDGNRDYAEEKSLLKEYTVPIVQFDIKKIMMIICHGGHNSVPKEQLVNRSNMQMSSGLSLVEENPMEANVKIAKLISSFVKKDKKSFDFYMNMVKQLLESGESEVWKKYVLDERQDIFMLGHGKKFYREDLKRLNGYTEEEHSSLLDQLAQ